MRQQEKKTIYFADLFAGVGGFHHAILNISRSDDININFKCKLVSEIDHSAKKVYSHKFHYEFNKIKDIFDINPEKDMKNIELVFCGFPCQPFSTAGMRKGFADNKSGELIFQVININGMIFL